MNDLKIRKLSLSEINRARGLKFCLILFLEPKMLRDYHRHRCHQSLKQRLKCCSVSGFVLPFGRMLQVSVSFPSFFLSNHRLN